MNSFKTNKFNKGDKILGQNCEGLGMYAFVFPTSDLAV